MTIPDESIVERLRDLLATGGVPPVGMEERIARRAEDSQARRRLGLRRGSAERETAWFGHRPRFVIDLAAAVLAAAVIVTATVVLPRLASGPARPAPGPVVAGPTGTATTTPITTALPSPSIPATPAALQLVQPASYQPCQGTVQPVVGGGLWVMTGSSLLVSSDGGAPWSDVTPSGVNLSDSSFCALDGSDAWLAAVTATDASGGPAEVGVFQTSNGGTTWTRTATVPDTSEAYPRAIQFVDAEHGWLMMGLPGMAQSALLFGTDDGGATWTRLASTYSGDLDFVSASQGWLAFPGGGAGGQGVYATTDGGQTWTLTSAAFLAPVGGDECVALEGFRFLSPSVGVAATSSYGCGGVGDFDVWMTSDGGASWQEMASRPASTAASDSCGFDVISTTAWVALDCNSVDSVTALDWTFDGGAEWVTVPAEGLPDDASAVVFADSRDGFVLPVSSSPSSLYRTTDSGQDWQSAPLG